MKTHVPISDTTAVKLTYCPACHQPIGSKCVYMPKASPALKNADKTGQPMERAHNERRDAARAVLTRRVYRDAARAKAEAHSRRIGRATPPTTDAQAIWTAEQRWEHQERLRLSVWLHLFGSILTRADRHQG